MTSLDPSVCYRAIASRDRRFEGRFVVAVTSTGIYCRPGCPAPIPKRQNTRFFACAAGAEEAGFRPCMRCRPDASSQTSAWLGTSVTIQRALRLIADGSLEHEGIEPLASRLGMGARHLRRLFAEHVGASPIAVAQTRRVHFARKLIDETDLPMAEVAFASGFASVRRFNDAMKRTFRAQPTKLRRGRRGEVPEGELRLRLPFLAPYDWPRLVAFLGPRATPGVEIVEGGAYRRSFAVAEGVGVLHVSPDVPNRALVLRIRTPVSRDLFAVLERVRGLFDLAADPDAIALHLRRDKLLARCVAERPGLRVPGAWDPFELAVRAILGQQVTVKGATTLAGRLVRVFGEPLPAPVDGITHLFPTPSRLAKADLGTIGLPRARAAAITELAQREAGGEGLFAPSALEEAVRRLTSIRGVGSWTAHYVAMRALREPDAFPAGDLALRRAVSPRCTARELEARAEAWRPWRAYAAMHLWASLG